jgi:hypothetical protein
MDWGPDAYAGVGIWSGDISGVLNGLGMSIVGLLDGIAKYSVRLLLDFNADFDGI